MAANSLSLHKKMQKQKQKMVKVKVRVRALRRRKRKRRRRRRRSLGVLDRGRRGNGLRRYAIHGAQFVSGWALLTLRKKLQELMIELQ